MKHTDFASNWQEIASGFRKRGITAYGGPAIMGLMHTGLGGAGIAAAASCLPSFTLMLSILPVFERVRTLAWAKAAMRGVGPAVRGAMAVFLVRMALHALPDPLAVAILIGTLIALLTWHIGVRKLMMAGAVFGILRSRLLSLPGVLGWPRLAWCSALPQYSPKEASCSPVIYTASPTPLIPCWMSEQCLTLCGAMVCAALRSPALMRLAGRRVFMCLMTTWC